MPPGTDIDPAAQDGRKRPRPSLAKFVSTRGTSTYNREPDHPDWMHPIRFRAFAYLWMKALKVHEEGLTVVRHSPQW
ncbi:hypothetical protein [Streptomyces olivaceiscleroticus]|uniref:hypothetical protein n=1 Tax=Streptomyces olivaceiscleroticus TaxID=68245 RepID=UPI0031F8E0E2